jgi:uncharacterized membrane protein YphA (DoxX/SURF4 family)
MVVLRYAIRIITALVFIFSGTVKAIDPLGSAYKFQDYFQAFSLDFAKFLGLPLAVILCTAEFIAGLSVITGYRQKAGIWAILLMMLLFTPLTLVLAISNPVSDCGCFGDAIHLTNWQTFGKNIVLLLLVLFLFRERNRINPVFTPGKEWSLLAGAVVLFIMFTAYNLKYLPVIDFLPYNSGSNIAAKMEIPENMPADEYETTFIYEKEGIKKEFTLDNYPADDTTWIFVDQKSVLLKKGYVPPIHDFSITTLQNEDITALVLSDPGYSLLMIAKKLGEADEDNLTTGFDLGKHFKENGMGFYILTASTTEEVKKYDESLPFCFTDEITLKTAVRANPGYILLKNGNIIAKWSQSSLPGKEWFQNDMEEKQLLILNNLNGRLLMMTIVLAAMIIFLIFHILLKNKSNTKQII